jgi:hypothetical protein
MMKTFPIALSGAGRGLQRRNDGGDQTNVRLLRIVTMNPLYTLNIC